MLLVVMLCLAHKIQDRLSFIPPKDLRELRLISRYRRKLSAMCASEVNPFHYTQVLAASYRQHLDLAKCLIHKELPMPCCSETRCVKKLLSCS